MGLHSCPVLDAGSNQRVSEHYLNNKVSKEVSLARSLQGSHWSCLSAEGGLWCQAHGSQLASKGVGPHAQFCDGQIWSSLQLCEAGSTATGGA